MKLSELIEQAQEALSKHGNIDILINPRWEGFHTPVDHIEVTNELEYDDEWYFEIITE